MQIYREITNSGYYISGTRLTDYDVLTQYKLIGPATILSLARILLFSRIILKDVDTLIKLINIPSHNRGWCSALMSDLKWLCLSEHYSDFSDYDIFQWIVHIKSDPSKFANKVRVFACLPAANLNLSYSSPACS